MITDPPLNGSTALSKEERKISDMWHVTGDTRHMTHDPWHVTHGGGQTFSQNVSSIAVMVWERHCFDYIFTMDDWLSHAIN